MNPDPYHEYEDMLLIEEHKLHPERFTTIHPMNTLHPNDPKGEAGSKKTPLHLLPASALRPISEVLRHGAEKYGLWNWRHTKVNATTYHGAVLRHMALWGEGEDIDPESGLPHLAHAAASIMILLDAGNQGTLVDDRPKTGEKTYLGPLADLPPLPPVPEGYDRWEYRGWAWKRNTVATFAMCSGNAREWVIRQVSHANGEPAFFLEAVKDNAVGIPAGLPPLPPVPKGYSRWEYRGKAYLNNHTGYLAYNPLGHPGWVSRAMAIGAPGHYIEAVK